MGAAARPPEVPRGPKSGRSLSLHPAGWARLLSENKSVVESMEDPPSTRKHVSPRSVASLDAQSVTFPGEAPAAAVSSASVLPRLGLPGTCATECDSSEFRPAFGRGDVLWSLCQARPSGSYGKVALRQLRLMFRCNAPSTYTELIRLTSN